MGPQGGRSIRALAATLSVGLLWGAPAEVPAAESAASSGSLIVDGRLVFEAKGCGACHPVWATGDEPSVGPDLGKLSAGWQDVMGFAGALWNHLPGMAARMEDGGGERVRITPDETRALTAYLFYSKFVGSPGDPARGRTAFDVRGCSECHQLHGSGGRSGPRLDDLRNHASVAVLARALWNHAPVAAAAGFDATAGTHRLAERDVADMVALIRGGAPRREPVARAYLEVGTAGSGRAVFERFGCVWCHEGSETEAPIAPNLATDVHLDISGLAAAFWNHGPTMMARMGTIGLPFPQLGDADMADLLAYLAVKQFTGPAGDPERGRRLLGEKNCTGCHRPAEDDRPAPAPELAGSQAARSWWRWTTGIWNHATTKVDPAAPWPRFEGDEMRDLVASLEAEPPAR